MLNAKEGEDYTYKALLNREKQHIEIDLDFKKSIERTKIDVSITNPDYIMSKSGKKPVNRMADSDFSGHRVDSKVASNMVGSIGTGGETGGSVGGAVAIGLMTCSSLFTNSLSFLSKPIQVIEFAGKLKLFNFEFDPLLGNLLGKIGKMTNYERKGNREGGSNQEVKTQTPTPGNRRVLAFFNEMVSDHHNSKASQWKGKLSSTGVAPYFLQQAGYIGIPMIVSLISRDF